MAAAAVGLGVLTSCSTSKNEKQEPTYLQTEMLKLDNTLDSLKLSKNEGNENFFDYYDKSKAVIDNAQLDSKKSRDFKGNKSLIYGGLTVMWLSFISAYAAIDRAVNKSKDTAKAFKASMVAFGVGVASIMSGALGEDLTAINNKQKFEQHKEQKLQNLDVEKSEYLNASEISLGK